MSKIRDLIGDRKRLLAAIEDTQNIIGKISEATDRVELARGHLSAIGDELRMQVTVTRERCAWLMREHDRLRAEMEKILAQEADSP